MLNHHLAGLLGLGSLSWAGHLIHVSLPATKLMDAIDAGEPLVLNGKTIASVADIPLPPSSSIRTSWRSCIPALAPAFPHSSPETGLPTAISSPSKVA